MKTSMTRRDFLKYSAGAGLTVAVAVTPLGSRLLSAKELEDKAFSPSVWVQVTPDDIVHIIVNKSEMGQGVHTALPMILADQMDADWQKIKVVQAPAGKEYVDPVWQRESTGGSTSVRHMYEPLSKAGAAAREMLIEAAAKKWKVSASECEAQNGTVKLKSGGKSLTYGELAAAAAELPVPSNPSLKKKSSFTFIGKPMDRLDIPPKVHATASFGIDTYRPGMLYATVARPPAYGSKHISYEKEAALKVKGVKDVVVIDDGIAVCAEHPDGAWKGEKALNVKWSKGVEPDLSDQTLREKFHKELEKKGITARNDGDVGAAMGKATKKVEAVYYLPYLSHATMEPMNCTAHVSENSCEIWTPTQNQTGVLTVAEKVTGLGPDKITVHTTYLGGGFGRRFETKVAQEVLQISKAVKKPVKLIWTRKEDMHNDFYRPGNCAKFTAALDDKGNLTALSATNVVSSIFARAMPSAVKDGIDPAAVEGLKNMEYEVPNLKVDYVRFDSPVPVGFWRSVGSSNNGFTVESFIDEVAAAAGKEPLEFRLNLLKNHKRAHRVLEVVSEKAGWTKPLKGAQGRGIAQHMSFGSYVAQVAEVSVDKKEGTIKVHRVVCAVDCGPIVNPAIIEAQIRGAIIMGMSAALKEKIDFADGGPQTSNFDTYPLLRISEIPDNIEVHIIESTDSMGGIGEPGLPPIAPAVANGVFNATGVRIRELPMTTSRVKEAMAKA